MEGTAGTAGEVRAGQLNAAIANEIGKLTADFTGRGSEKSRAFITGDVVVCLLELVGDVLAGVKFQDDGISILVRGSRSYGGLPPRAMHGGHGRDSAGACRAR